MTDTASVHNLLSSRGEQTREKILDAAEAIFADKDFSAARLEDVAQVVGIRRASIVYYFANKQELYNAVESRVFAAMTDSIERNLQGVESAVDRVLTVLDSWLDFLVHRPSASRLILRDSAKSHAQASSSVRISAAAVRLWERELGAGQQSGELAEADPIHLLHLLGAGIVYYSATGQLLGEERLYDPAAPENLQAFRKLLHRNARALLLPEN
ncbi:TetR/AcrR family transcriptional regulator [Microbulbifer taiwanensis]|uniref:TetR/AcrR family transcriptional regulator n=1 Tax=Microbulbifer taiwanensis TaxID=986746 RepID=A0ABW1YNS6_9GAMM|nr:TetR/AcrR family transcriptional regulator [Microbulbifer taiwanensis]